MGDNPHNRLGLCLAIDTNIIGRASDAMTALWSLHEEGWIELSRTDVVDTELGGALDDKKRTQLLGESAKTSEYLGPTVWGHSRWGASLFATKGDQALLEDVLAIVHPRATITAASRGDLRDAMHVAWGIRYGLDGLVTNDKALIEADDTLRSRFRFRVLPPDLWLKIVLRLTHRCELRSL